MVLIQKLTKNLLFLTVFGQTLMAMPPKRTETLLDDGQTISIQQQIPTTAQKAIEAINYFSRLVGEKVTETRKGLVFESTVKHCKNEELIKSFRGIIELGAETLKDFEQLKSDIDSGIPFLPLYDEALGKEQNFMLEHLAHVNLYFKINKSGQENNSHGLDNLSKTQARLRIKAETRQPAPKQQSTKSAEQIKEQQAAWEAACKELLAGEAEEAKTKKAPSRAPKGKKGK